MFWLHLIVLDYCYLYYMKTTQTTKMRIRISKMLRVGTASHITVNSVSPSTFNVVYPEDTPKYSVNE